MQAVVIAIYNLSLIGALMYTVGYLGWSAWWLLLLILVGTYKKGGE